MKQISTLLLVCLLLHARGFSQTPNRYDVVIDEIMADPTPQVGLPNAEWIELYNRSSTPINLLGWRIGDASGQSGSLPSYILKPDSFVLVCTASAVASLSAYGPVISVTSFPSLDNDGDMLYLKSAQNRIIHAISYSGNWYRNALKQEGGWTLEMIDTRNPCSGEDNWSASTDVKGGTPGKKNAADAVNPDKTIPALSGAFATDSLNISLNFNETLDSLVAAQVTHYSISDGIGTPISATALPPLFDQVNLKLGTPLQRNRIYVVTVSTLTDCAGNTVDPQHGIRVGLAETVDSFDVVINEILFNPRPGGVDYVELYNRSTKNIDLAGIRIANRNGSGQVSSITTVSAKSKLFFPADYILLTTDGIAVRRDYITTNPEAFVETASLPSFNDDKGDVILLNRQGSIVDELAYSYKWHFKLIDNPEGVALERIDQHAPTQLADNWHSAATSVGYGTPGYRNSQYRPDESIKGEVDVSPEIVSPDNDGMDDFATIAYRFPSPGYVANITLYDALGRPVRYLQRNALCGIAGNYRWDGLGEQQQKLPVGIYIVLTEVFNLEGKKKQFKHVLVLARRN